MWLCEFFRQQFQPMLPAKAVGFHVRQDLWLESGAAVQDSDRVAGRHDPHQAQPESDRLKVHQAVLLKTDPGDDVLVTQQPHPLNVPDYLFGFFLDSFVRLTFNSAFSVQCSTFLAVVDFAPVLIRPWLFTDSDSESFALFPCPDSDHIQQRRFQVFKRVSGSYFWQMRQR